MAERIESLRTFGMVFFFILLFTLFFLYFVRVFPTAHVISSSQISEQLFYDDFENGSANWVTSRGESQIIEERDGNHVFSVKNYPTIPKTYDGISINWSGWKDITIETKFRFDYSSSNKFFSLIPRINWSLSNGRYMLTIDSSVWSNGLGSLRFHSAGLADVIKGVCQFNTSEWHTLKFRFSGDLMKIYLDGKRLRLDSYYDLANRFSPLNNQTARSLIDARLRYPGSEGLSIGGGESNYTFFDNFNVTRTVDEENEGDYMERAEIVAQEAGPEKGNFMYAGNNTVIFTIRNPSSENKKLAFNITIRPHSNLNNFTSYITPFINFLPHQEKVINISTNLVALAGNHVLFSLINESGFAYEEAIAYLENPAPLDIEFDNMYYHQNESMNLSYSFNIKPDEINNLSVKAQLFRKRGTAPLREEVINNITQKEGSFQSNSSILEKGYYYWNVAVYNKEDALLFNIKSEDIKIIDQPYIDELEPINNVKIQNNRILVNGKLFFPILDFHSQYSWLSDYYSKNDSDNIIKQHRLFGFNLIQSSTEELDTIWKMNFYGYTQVPGGVGVWTDNDIPKGQYNITRMINSVTPNLNKSNIFNWLIQDEPNNYFFYGTWPNETAFQNSYGEFATALKQTDPNHIIHAELTSNSYNVGSFAPYSDTIAQPDLNYERAFNDIKNYNVAIIGSLWSCDQNYGFILDPNVLRKNTYDAIIRGVKGLEYFGFVTSECGDMLKRKPETWYAFEGLLSEINELRPIIMAPESNLKINVTYPAGALVRATLKEYENKLYLIATNVDYHGYGNTTFNIFNLISEFDYINPNVAVLWEGGNVTINSTGSFKDYFDIWETHVYIISGIRKQGFDACNNTPPAEVEDKYGCSCSQKLCDDFNPCTDNNCNFANGECSYIINSSRRCGSFIDCPLNSCIGERWVEFPESNMDYCSVTGTCLPYSCKVLNSSFQEVCHFINFGKSNESFLDNFEDNKQIGWNTFRGNWREENGSYSINSIERNAYATLGNPNWFDYAVEVDIKLDDFNEGSSEGSLLFNIINDSAQYMLEWILQEDSTGIVRIDKKYDSLHWRVGYGGTKTINDMDPSKWYHLKVIVNKNASISSITGNGVNETIIFVDNNGPYINGKVGLYSWESFAHFDNFQVTLFENGSFIVIGNYCGDGNCTSEESCLSCSYDCGSCSNICGNGVCDNGETSLTCPADCRTYDNTRSTSSSGGGIPVKNLTNNTNVDITTGRQTSGQNQLIGLNKITEAIGITKEQPKIISWIVIGALIAGIIVVLVLIIHLFNKTYGKHEQDKKKEEVRKAIKEIKKIETKENFSEGFFAKLSSWIKEKTEEAAKRREENAKRKEQIKKEKLMKLAAEEKARTDKEKELQKIEEAKRNKIFQGQQVSIVDQEILKKINILLLQGQSYVDLNMKERARQTYNELRNLYKNLKNKDKELYDKIVKFYGEIKYD